MQAVIPLPQLVVIGFVRSTLSPRTPLRGLWRYHGAILHDPGIGTFTNLVYDPNEDRGATPVRSRYSGRTSRIDDLFNAGRYIVIYLRSEAQ